MSVEAEAPQDYKWSLKLPFLNGLSEEMLFLLSQKFKIRYVPPPTRQEIKLQKFKDKL